ncbi:unnamed protein product [Protopolystoma xenopodis]|uniref:Uncharacterized protein n=1 Tax=Protopolystoma xenopodis TaxID=117903 RepID=A0A3S4ZSA2_9PLAT|nr:unnamed protein product [Protopolystoma xenopodis]
MNRVRVRCGRWCANFFRLCLPPAATRYVHNPFILFFSIPMATSRIYMIVLRPFARFHTNTSDCPTSDCSSERITG